MSRICVEMPKQIIDDLSEHIGEDKKFVNMSDAVRSSMRKMLDQLDVIDRRHGRIKDEQK